MVNHSLNRFFFLHTRQSRSHGAVRVHESTPVPAGEGRDQIRTNRRVFARRPARQVYGPVVVQRDVIESENVLRTVNVLGQLKPNQTGSVAYIHIYIHTFFGPFMFTRAFPRVLSLTSVLCCILNSISNERHWMVIVCDVGTAIKNLTIYFPNTWLWTYIYTFQLVNIQFL